MKTQPPGAPPPAAGIDEYGADSWRDRTDLITPGVETDLAAENPINAYRIRDHQRHPQRGDNQHDLKRLDR